jgi:Uma2 family endonuclease
VAWPRRGEHAGGACDGQRDGDPGLEERAGAGRITSDLAECGGRTWIEAGFLHGPPELVVEVSKATRYVDLGPNFRDYERAGVLDYVVRAIEPDEIFWFDQQQGELVARALAPDGLYRSSVFPGLWLDPSALLFE